MSLPPYSVRGLNPAVVIGPDGVPVATFTGRRAWEGAQEYVTWKNARARRMHHRSQTTSSDRPARCPDAAAGQE